MYYKCILYSVVKLKKLQSLLQSSIQKDNLPGFRGWFCVACKQISPLEVSIWPSVLMLYTKRLFLFFRSGLTSVISPLTSTKLTTILKLHTRNFWFSASLFLLKLPKQLFPYKNILITQDKSGNFVCFQETSAAALLSGIPLIWVCWGSCPQELILKTQTARRESWWAR